MLQKLSVASLTVPASVLSLTTWADAKDVKQLYRNEFAQVGLEQVNPNVELPEFDEFGNPIPTAAELYPICFNDFQLYLAQIDGIIVQIEELDQTIIPAAATALWVARGLDPNVDQLSLQDLADEYTSVLGSGTWPAIDRVPPTYAVLNNLHCDYLPEFILMREFIGNRTLELEDKGDFAAWMEFQSEQPQDPCPAAVGAFEEAKNSLQDQITTEEQAKADLLQALFEEFGEGQEKADFDQNLDETFILFRDADFLTVQSDLVDLKPDAVEGCEDQLGPLGAELDMMALNLKDLIDFQDFAPEFLCNEQANVLSGIYNNNLNTAADADIQIQADILNLLVIQGDDSIDASPENLRAQLRDAYDNDADVPKDCDPGFVAPDGLPAVCDGGPAQQVLDALADLYDDTSDALCFRDYVQSALNEGCGLEHQARITELEDLIADADGTRFQVTSALFAAFAQPDQPFELYQQFLEGGYFIAQFDGEYEGTNELQDEKPEVPADCAGQVDELNLEIDNLAIDLKDVMDLTDYLPIVPCGELGTQIQAILDANAGAAVGPAANAAMIIADLFNMEGLDGESAGDFQGRIAEEFAAAGVTPEDPGFALPSDAFPEICGDSSAFDALDSLVTETTSALTISKWLEGRLEGACGTAGADHQVVLTDVTLQADAAENAKTQLIMDFFQDFAADGQFLEGYTAELKSAYDDAKANGLLFEPLSDVQFTLPDVSDSCVDMVAPIRDQIATKIAELNDDIDCQDFVADMVCSGLAEEVSLINQQGDVILQGNQVRVQALLNDLIMIEGIEGEDLLSFEFRMQDEYRDDPDRPIGDSGLATPTDEVPEACSGVSYANVNLLIQFASDVLGFEQYIEDRLGGACGDTQLEFQTIAQGVADEAGAAIDAKGLCIAELFDAFASEDDDLNAYSIDLLERFNAAFVAGEIPVNDYSVELPETPEMCADLLDPIEAAIDGSVAALTRAQDCTVWITKTVCLEVNDQLSDILDASENYLEIFPRIELLLADILTIEGLEGEDLDDLEARLRGEYFVDDSVVIVDSGIVLPSASLPEKCEDYASYSDVENRMALVSELLSFEQWLIGRLNESCGESGSQFQAIVDGLNSQVNDAVIAKTTLISAFYDDFGGDTDIVTYASELDALYQAAKLAGDIESNFEEVADIDVPVSPDSCSSVTNPIFQDIQSSIVELTDFLDCIDFTRTQVCTDLQAQVRDIQMANMPILDDKAVVILQNLQILLPALGNEGEDLEFFAIRMTQQFNDDIINGDFELLPADFSTPTEVFPDACTGYATYVDLEDLVEDAVEACSLDAWLDQLIENAAGASIEAHGDELSRLEHLKDTAEDEQDGLVEQLFNSFGIDDQSIEMFRDYLDEEFTTLNDAGMLPQGDTVVDVMIPIIPEGFEGLVEDLRDQIGEEADGLGDVIDFNAFAFNFVCEEARDEIQVVIDEAFVIFEGEKVDLSSIMNDLFIIEGEDDDTIMTFETKLRDQFADEPSTAADSEDDEETPEVPYDVIPDGCAEGQAKLSELEGVLADIADIRRFQAFLAPRIDEVAIVFLHCQESKKTLEDLVAAEFSQWTECIGAKSKILYEMYEADGNGDDFKMFIEMIRMEYDRLKDEGKIVIITPDLTIDPVLEQCPEDVHDQLSIAEQFKGILEDCLSYKEWLLAQQGGMCDLEQFESVIADNTPRMMEVMDQLTQTLVAIQQITPENDQTPEDFAASKAAEFEAAAPETIDSGIVVPETSMACGQETADAQQAAFDFVDELEAKLTFIEFLQEQLNESCSELESDYNGIRVLAEPHLFDLEEQRDVLLHALFVFKGTDGETLEAFTVRMMDEYMLTDPMIIPVMSLKTFIDIPEMCKVATSAVEAAEQLLATADGINFNTPYIPYLEQKLEECNDASEMSMEEQFEMNMPRVTMANQDKKKQLDDLFSFAAADGETMEEFTARLMEEFDEHLDNTDWELVDSGIVIPTIPEDSDDADLIAARDALVQQKYDLEYCLTLVEWLKEGIAGPCEVLRNHFLDQLTAESPRVDACLDNVEVLLTTLKSIKDADGMMDDEEFAFMIAMQYGMVTVDTIDAGISLLPVPLVCPDPTHDALVDLMAMITELEECLTYELWLDEQASDCCQNLGLEFVQLTEEKEEDIFNTGIQNEYLAANIALMDGRTMDDLVAECEVAATEPGFEPYDDNTVIKDVPAECQQSVLDARQTLVDTCDEYNADKTFQACLVNELETTCLDQVSVLDQIINDNTPVMNDLTDEKIAMFATWAELGAREGETAAEFQERMMAGFFAAVDAGDVALVDSGIDLVAVTQECPQEALDKLDEAANVIRELDLIQTLCDWIRDSLDAACADLGDDINDLLMTNEPRYEESRAKQIEILTELFTLGKADGFATLDMYIAEMMFQASTAPAVDTGIVVPAVPEGCDQDVKDAAGALQDFIDILGPVLGQENFMKDFLRDCCEEWEVAITDQIAAISMIVDDCADRNFLVLSDAYGIEKIGDENFIDYNLRVRAIYDADVASGAVTLVDSPLTLQTISPNCHDDILSSYEELLQWEQDYVDCLTFEIWIKQRLLTICDECQEKFEDQIDYNKIILAAAELRATDQLDNLFVLKEDEIAPETFDEFSLRIFDEFSAIDMPMMPHNIDIPVIAPDCSAEVHDLAQMLTELAGQISNTFTFEKYVKGLVKECLHDTEGEYEQILDDNESRSDDAAATVVMALDEIYSVKANDGEDRGMFAARMKGEFDADDTVVLMETGIEIQELPPNAPPSTKNAMRVLAEFRDRLAYQLTWAQWLMDKLEMCCDDVAQGYLDLEAANQSEVEAKVARSAAILNVLYSLDDTQAVDLVEFAENMRERFDMEAADPANGIVAVDTGLVIEAPPANCQQSTFDAYDDLNNFNLSFSDICTYLEWLEDMLADASSDLADEINALVLTNTFDLNEKADDLTATLESLFEMLGQDGEIFADFSDRMRADFDADDTVVPVESNIIVPIIPENAMQDAKDAAADLQAVKDELIDCLTYQAWLEALLVDSCDALTDEIVGIQNAQPAKDAYDAEVMEALYALVGNDVETFEEFAARIRDVFDMRPEGTVEDAESTIDIPDVPETCQDSTKAAREDLVAFDNACIDQNTFDNWLEDIVSDETEQNDQECADLIDEYNQIVADNLPRVQESKDRSIAATADAFIVKGFEDESLADFTLRIQMIFETYDPLPVSADIDYQEMPLTCEEATTDAHQALVDFIAELENELRFEAFLMKKLENCCNDVEAEIAGQVDESVLDDFAVAKLTMLEDLFTLIGNDGETLVDFTARMLEDFEAAAVDNIPTGIVYPQVPPACYEMNPGLADAEEDLGLYEEALQECLNLDDWLKNLVDDACSNPQARVDDIIAENAPRIDAARETQQELLDPLYVFKGLHDESYEDFQARLRTVFMENVVPRMNADIDPPTVPDSCDQMMESTSAELDQLISDIQDEETYAVWLEANLNACCDARGMWIQEQIDEHSPTLDDLTTMRDEMLSGIYESTNNGESQDVFIQGLDAEYDAAVANGDVAPGFTDIMQTVPPVPESCGQDILDAQGQLIDVAQGIEDLEAQIGWLEPMFAEVCTEREPELQAILDMDIPNIDTVSDDVLAGLFGNLFTMEAEEGEQLIAFYRRVREVYDAEGIAPTDLGVDIPVVNEACPESTQELAEDVSSFIDDAQDRLSFGPWLQTRAEGICAERHDELHDIIWENVNSRDAAKDEAAMAVEAAFDVVANSGETLEEFNDRMMVEHVVTGPMDMSNVVLPVFSDSCPAEEVANLEEAMTVIEESLRLQSFIVWLNQQVNGNCDVIEAAIEARIDVVDQEAKAAEREQLYETWYQVDESGPVGETYEDFKTRMDGVFATQDIVVDTGIDITPYPERCDDESNSIDGAQRVLEEYERAVSDCLAFQAWAGPLVVPLINSHCASDSDALDLETAALSSSQAAMIGQQENVVFNFLDNFDNENVDMLPDAEYYDAIIVPAAQQAIAGGAVTLPALSVATTQLPTFCLDRSSETEFNDAALALQAQAALGDYIEGKTGVICANIEGFFVNQVSAATQNIANIEGLKDTQLAINFAVATKNGDTMADLAGYTDAELEAMVTGGFEPQAIVQRLVDPVPADFCQASLYQAIDDYNIQIDSINSIAGFGQYLEEQAIDFLCPKAESQIMARNQGILDLITAQQGIVDARVQELFDQDQLRATAFFADLAAAMTYYNNDFNVAGVTPIDAGEVLAESCEECEPFGFDASVVDTVNGNIELLNRAATFANYMMVTAVLPEVSVDECGLYQITVDGVAGDTQDDADQQLLALGLNDNATSRANFEAAVALVSVADNIANFTPVDALPAGCDPVDLTALDTARENANYVAQFFDWCADNQGGLCAPE